MRLSAHAPQPSSHGMGCYPVPLHSGPVLCSAVHSPTRRGLPSRCTLHFVWGRRTERGAQEGAQTRAKHDKGPRGPGSAMSAVGFWSIDTRAHRPRLLQPSSDIVGECASLRRRTADLSAGRLRVDPPKPGTPWCRSRRVADEYGRPVGSLGVIEGPKPSFWKSGRSLEALNPFIYHQSPRK